MPREVTRPSTLCTRCSIGISADRAAARTKLENAALLGQSYVNVPYLNSDSLEQWQAWADAMNTEARMAKRLGLRYGYHNHAHEFTIDLGGGVTPWDILTSELDPRLVHLLEPEADLQVLPLPERAAHRLALRLGALPERVAEHCPVDPLLGHHPDEALSDAHQPLREGTHDAWLGSTVGTN